MSESQVNVDHGRARPYASPVREERARATQRRVMDAAYDLFLTQGYPSTTVSAIAERAGVSAQTIYNGFGSKAALLKRVYDVRLAGDDEPVPLAQRPEVVAAYAERDPVSFLRSYARLARQISERVGPFALVLMDGAAAGDPELKAHVETMNQERLVGARMVANRVRELGALRPGLSVDRARDVIWTINSVEVWHLLTGLRGWSARAYEDWVGRAWCDAVLRNDHVY